MGTPQHGYWIQTHTGVAFDLLAPTAGMVVLEDIAYALSRLCRFTGHCSRHYSVAEHSVNVAKQCQLEHGFSDSWAMAALLHDAAEAYIGDLSSPLKSLLRVCAAPAGEEGADLRGMVESPLDRVEHRIKGAIAEHFGTDILWRSTYSKAWQLDSLAMVERKQLIKAVDLRMLATERRDLMPAEPVWEASAWVSATACATLPEPYEWTIRSSTAHYDDATGSYHRFMDMFARLGGRR